MTAIRSERAPRVGVRWTKTTFVGLAFAIVGVVAGLGISNLLSQGDSANSFQGPLVDRSLAMDGNINALIESGRAQAAAIRALPEQYAGPLVDRSLAMDRFYASVPGTYSGPLVERSLAMDRFYASVPGTYAGPLVERSLAMDRNVDALIESGRAQVAALESGG